MVWTIRNLLDLASRPLPLSSSPRQALCICAARLAVILALAVVYLALVAGIALAIHVFGG